MLLHMKVFQRIPIDRGRVLTRLGHTKERQKPTRSFTTLVSATIDLAQVLIQPKQIVSMLPIEQISAEKVVLERALTITSSRVAVLLEGCTRVFMFVVTIGPRLEEKRDHFIAQNEPTQALILDACGSEAAETYAGLVARAGAAAFKKGRVSATPRYSPGYGDWDITDQQQLLDFLGAARIGITLSETATMKPEKSISALMGLRGA